MPVGISKATFEQKEYDVTNTCAFVCGCCMTSSILILGEEEIHLTNKDCCSNQERRLPYGELGSVELMESCGCCIAFGQGTPIAGPGPNGEAGGTGISPGCGCATELVQEIVAELKARQQGRGDQAKMRYAEDTYQKVSEMEDELSYVKQALNLIMTNLGVSAPPEPVSQQPGRVANTNM